MAIYLFYGEETYLLETRVKKIKKEFPQLILGINFIQIDDTNVEELISDLETPAFGFGKKLIIAKNTGLFKKEKKTKKNKRFPLNPELKVVLEDFVKDRPEDQPLFITQQGNRLDRNQAYRIISKAAKLLNIPDRMGTH